MQSSESIEDVPFQDITAEEMANATNLQTLAVQKVEEVQSLTPSSTTILDLSQLDTKEATKKCQEFVDLIVKAKLPKTLASNQAIVDLISMSKNMHAQSLSMMLVVCKKAYDVVTMMSTDEIYSTDGKFVDPFRVQTLFGAYQSTMNLAAQLSAFVQRLPSILQQAIQDATFMQVLTMQAEAEKRQDENRRSMTTSVPMAVIMRRAQEEAEANAEVPIERGPAEPVVVPETVKEPEVDLNNLL